ncbi:MAG TPA: hypothetical protein VEF36_01355 [Roseiarcus sp.]|nr:hypothetical protein [Roseiarcus sp.]
MAKPLIEIDADSRTVLQAMAEPYFGKADCSGLMRAIGAHLQARHPKRQIDVAHVAHEPDLWAGRIRALVIVDGAMDQGLIFTRSSANDYLSRAA